MKNILLIYTGGTIGMIQKNNSLNSFDFDNLKNTKLSFDEKQIDFFLEEHLMAHLITKGQVSLYNKFIDGRENWILLAYPDKPPKALTYLYQKDFLKLDNPKNVYQDSWYDLEEKKLYDHHKINLNI